MLRLPGLLSSKCKEYKKYSSEITPYPYVTVVNVII